MTFPEVAFGTDESQVTTISYSWLVLPELKTTLERFGQLTLTAESLGAVVLKDASSASTLPTFSILNLIVLDAPGFSKLILNVKVSPPFVTEIVCPSPAVFPTITSSIIFS